MFRRKNTNSRFSFVSWLLAASLLVNLLAFGPLADSVRAFKLKSPVPVKITITGCDGQLLTTGVHTIQVVKFSNSTTSDLPIDATPTDGATTGNELRLTDAATVEWHFNLSTTGPSRGIWQIQAILSDGSTHTGFIELK